MEKKKLDIQIFITGAIIGLAVFLAVYGPGVLNFTDDSFLINGYIEKDIEQHYAGWMLYRNSPWQFPVGVGQNIAYPYGSSVSYTDSIPLFAIFFKIFRGILPRTFQYFGLFVLLCFMLQGGFGGLLAGLFSKDLVMCGLSSVIFVFSPVMIERAFRHCALTAHFIILAALYFYFKNKGRKGAKAYLPFFVINLLAMAVHPYYLPFTFGIMFALCLENFFVKENRKPALLSLAGSIALTLLFGWAIGAFYVGGSMSAIGYGTFNMNLNAFFNPVSRGISNWSRAVGIRPHYIVWQIEGFNYLGLGVLLMLPVSAVLYLLKSRENFFKEIIAFAKKHFGIIFSASALFLFALGDWITFGGLRLFRLPIPEKLYQFCGIFRANGRFGWIAVYLILLFEVYVLCRCAKDKKRIFTALTVIACAVQMWDLSDVLASKNACFTGKDGDMQGQITEKILVNSFWNEAPERYDCAHLLDNGYPQIGIDLARNWGKRGKAVFSNFQARIDRQATADFVEKAYGWLKDGGLPESELLCVGYLSQENAENLRDNGYDVYYSNHTYVVCRPKFSNEELQEFEKEGDFKVLEYPYTIPEEE